MEKSALAFHYAQPHSFNPLLWLKSIVFFFSAGPVIFSRLLSALLRGRFCTIFFYTPVTSLSLQGQAEAALDGGCRRGEWRRRTNLLVYPRFRCGRSISKPRLLHARPSQLPPVAEHEYGYVSYAPKAKRKG